MAGAFFMHFCGSQKWLFFSWERQVMAALIASAKVMGEDRLEVAWKYGDVYEKILGEMQ